MMGVSEGLSTSPRDAGSAAQELGVFLGAESTDGVGAHRDYPSVGDFQQSSAAGMSSVTPTAILEQRFHPGVNSFFFH